MTRLSQVQDELVITSVTIANSDVVRISLKMFTPEWRLFIKGIISRDKLRIWNRLWDGFIQEELTDEDIHLNKKSSNDDVALVARMGGNRKKDLTKIKSFNSVIF